MSLTNYIQNGIKDSDTKVIYTRRKRKPHQNRKRCGKVVTIILVGFMLGILGQPEKINIAEAKDNNIEKEVMELIGMDHTSPVITPLNIEGGDVYFAGEFTGMIKVAEDYKLDSMEIYVNDEKIQYRLDKTKDCYTFSLFENTEKRTIEILAMDIAGNMAHFVIDDVYVTSNVFVWLINNTRFILDWAGVFALLGGMLIILAINRKYECHMEKNDYKKV